MKYSEFVSIRKFEEQLVGMNLLLQAADFMPLLLGGREKIKELKKQMKKLKQQLEEIKTTPDEF